MPRTRVDEVEVRVDADLNPATRELRRASRETDKAARAMSRDFDRVDKSARNLNNGVNLMRVAIAAVGIVAGRTAFRMLEFASSIEEQGSKAAVVFGGNIGRVREELTELGDEVGRSRYELLNMASTLQDTFVPLGFTRKAAADLSVQMTQLAVDVGSFNNVASDQVAVAFQSAIVGNHETVRRFGIVITEATLKAEAYASGIADVGSQLTAQEKVQARINLILKGTRDAQGDAARTAHTYANQQARLRGEFQDYIVALTSGHLDTAATSVGLLARAFDALEKAQTRANLARQSYYGIAQTSQNELEAVNAELRRVQADLSGANGVIASARASTSSVGSRALRIASRTGITTDDAFDLIANGNEANTADALRRISERERQNVGVDTRFRHDDTASSLNPFGGAGERINLNSSNLALQEYERRQVAERSARTAGSLDPFGGSGEHLDQAIQDFEEGQRKISELNDRITDSFTELGDGIADGIASGLVNGSLELSNFEDLFKQFIANLIAEYIKIALFDKAFGFLAGAFTGGGGGTPGAGVGSLSAARGYQQGGYLQPGRLGLVGENGPELIVPKVGSTIVPNGRGVDVGGNSVQINLAFNSGISQADRATFLGMLPEIEARLGKNLLDTLNRSGVASNTIRTR